MRRGAGIGGLIKNQQQSSVYKDVGKQMEETQLEQLTRQLSQFQSQLSSFAASHKAAINANPILRYRFHLACTSIGVDPLTSQRSLFSSLLSLGDLYWALAVHIIECTMLTRPIDGGLMGMHELLAMLHRKTKQRVSESDVRQAVERMGVLGGGFALVDVGGGRVMVRSVPQQLDVDEMHVLSWLNARRSGGRYTVTEAETGLHWSRRRVDEVTRRMMQAGLLWIDAAADGKEDDYWFYSLFMEHMNATSGDGASERSDSGNHDGGSVDGAGGGVGLIVGDDKGAG